MNISSFNRILEQDEDFAEDLSEGEPGCGGQIDFEEDSYARSPASSVPSAEDEFLLDDSYTREIMYNNYNDVIFETDCNQPSSCINPLISEISVPEIQREKFQPSPVPKISSITALPLSQSPSIPLYPSPPRPSCSYVPTSPQITAYGYAGTSLHCL